MSIPSFRTPTIKTHVARNRSALIRNDTSLLAQIAGFREDYRKNDQLSVGHPEACDGLLSFLDKLAEDIEKMTASVPNGDKEFTDEDAEGTASNFARFIARAKPGTAKVFTAEILGDAVPPASIIPGIGTVGYLVTGFNPPGFGAGTLAGKCLTIEIKSGAVADKVEKFIAENDPPSEPWAGLQPGSRAPKQTLRLPHPGEPAVSVAARNPNDLAPRPSSPTPSRIPSPVTSHSGG